MPSSTPLLHSKFIDLDQTTYQLDYSPSNSSFAHLQIQSSAIQAIVKSPERLARLKKLLETLFAQVRLKVITADDALTLEFSLEKLSAGINCCAL